MRRLVCIRNRQKTRRVDTRLLRQVVSWALAGVTRGTPCELCVHLVGSSEMARVNKQFLNHDGSTDVITFDHRELLSGAAPARPGISGEIFISMDDAVAQARTFNSSWQSELARYVIHGILHLQGYDDRDARARRVMKREENRLLKLALKTFPLQQLVPRVATRAPRK